MTSAVVTSTGIVIPTFQQVLDELTAAMRTIYGSDIVVTPDSQDGQFLAVIASAINDANQMAVAVYNQFSPITAQGAGLSSVVKINGIARLAASRSTVAVTIVGQAGTLITNGIIGDNQGNGTRWLLPSSVVIELDGDVTVTATCEVDGAVQAAPGTLTQILTPTRGWQSVTNAADASPGDPVESDAQLRQRQAISTALPAESVLNAILASCANLPGVSRIAIYENDTGITDSNGIPGHSISLVVEGGDVDQIAEAIALTKTPGTGTYGTTEVTVIDPKGVPNVINFFELEIVEIDIELDITALFGYVTTTEDLIKAALAQFITTLGVGVDSYYGDLWSPANLSGIAAVTATGFSQAQLDAFSATYKITSIEQAVHGDPVAPSDVAILFNQAAACVVANIIVNIT